MKPTSHIGSQASLRAQQIGSNDVVHLIFKESAAKSQRTELWVKRVWVKSKPPRTAGFGPCFHLPGFPLGFRFLTTAEPPLGHVGAQNPAPVGRIPYLHWWIACIHSSVPSHVGHGILFRVSS